MVILFMFFSRAEKGPNGGPFLVDPLEKGFLGMADDHGMKFALMWANQVVLISMIFVCSNRDLLPYDRQSSCLNLRRTGIEKKDEE